MLGFTISHPERTVALALLAPGAHDYPWPADHPYFAETSSLIGAQDRDGLVLPGLRTMAPAGSSDVIDAMLRRAPLVRGSRPAYRGLASQAHEFHRHMSFTGPRR